MAARIHTEGRQWIQEVCFTEQQSVPTNFYVGLCTDISILENAALSDLTELTDDPDTGYERFPLLSSTSGWTSAATGSNDRKVTSSTITFTCDGTGLTWTKAYHWFLATTIDDSGKLVMSGPLNSGSGTAVVEGTPLTFSIVFTFPSD